MGWEKKLSPEFFAFDNISIKFLYNWLAMKSWISSMSGFYIIICANAIAGSNLKSSSSAFNRGEGLLNRTSRFQSLLD